MNGKWQGMRKFLFCRRNDKEAEWNLRLLLRSFKVMLKPTCFLCLEFLGIEPLTESCAVSITTILKYNTAVRNF